MRLEMRARVAFLGVDEVGELQRVADEEDRRVVAGQVLVALGNRVPESGRQPLWRIAHD
jgi:hypothetical protein